MGMKYKTPTSILILKLWQSKFQTEENDVVAASIWGTQPEQDGLYPKSPITRQKRLEDEMRKALKRSRHTDPQGRTKVKTYGSLPLFDPETGKESFTYIDMRRANESQGKKILDHEHAGIANDVKSHSISRQSFNDNNLFGAELPLYDYNFNAIAEDAALTGEYDDSFDRDGFDPDNES